MRHRVCVRFDGEVFVDTPDHLSEKDAKMLAEKIAAARILATVENPDAPEDVACEEWLDECPAGKEQDWDDTTIGDVSGIWTSGEAH